MLEYFKWRWNNADQHTLDCTKAKQWKKEHNIEDNSLFVPNIWPGVTVCNPDEKHKIDTLRQIQAAVRFISIEPCLADMGELDLTGIHWVIVGGESGPGARYCSIENIRSVVKQCQAAGVPVFVKQIHLYGEAKVIKDINQFPPDLRIREYPK